MTRALIPALLAAVATNSKDALRRWTIVDRVLARTDAVRAIGTAAIGKRRQPATIDSGAVAAAVNGVHRVAVARGGGIHAATVTAAQRVSRCTVLAGGQRATAVAGTGRWIDRGPGSTDHPGATPAPARIAALSRIAVLARVAALNRITIRDAAVVARYRG